MGSIGHQCRTIQGSSPYMSLMTVLALREVSIWSSITLLDQQSLSQAWIECGNKTLLALLPTASRDKTFVVIGMQFSIGKMIKGRHNAITLCPIDRTDYHFRNLWA